MQRMTPREAIASWDSDLTPPVTATLQVEEELSAKGQFSFVIFCLYTFILMGRPQDYFPELASLRPAMLFTVLAIAATAMRAGKSVESPFRQIETKLYLMLFAAMCLGIPFALHRRESFDAVLLQYVVNIAFYWMFLIHVDSVAKLKQIGIVLLFSSMILTHFALQYGEFQSGRLALDNLIYDPNDIAFVEISLLAFAIWIVLGSFGRVLKGAALVSTLLATLVTLYTGSRGGLLGLSTFFLLFLWLRLPHVRRSFKAVLCVAVIVAAVMNAGNINIDRYVTLTSLEDDYNFSDEFGRIDVWERGIQLFVADPLTGVGVGNFPNAIGVMRDKENRIPYWQAAHSAYLQVLAETGILGMTAFVLLLATCLTTFTRLHRRGRTVADVDLAILPGLLLIGFIALLISATFLSMAYSMFLTLFFAASAALKRIAAAQSQVVHAEI
jgi:O-antigen ligase